MVISLMTLPASQMDSRLHGLAFGFVDACLYRSGRRLQLGQDSNPYIERERERAQERHSKRDRERTRERERERERTRERELEREID